MRKQRRNYTAEQKVAILKEHLVEGKPLSDLCDAYDLDPTVFYRWQWEFFEKGALGLREEGRESDEKIDQKIAKLEKKLTKKNEVLSELMEEHVALKKKHLGKPEGQVGAPRYQGRGGGFYPILVGAQWDLRHEIYRLAGLGIAPSKYYDWKRRYGKVNEHNGWIPRRLEEALREGQ